MNRRRVGWSAAALVATLCVGTGLVVHGAHAAGLYIAAIATFHLLEFVSVWLWRRQQLSAQSFALNGVGHIVALTIGLVEHGARGVALGPMAWDGPLIALGLTTMSFGLLVRLWAMRTAGHFFNHTMQTSLGTAHRLVDGGPYRWLRHPSYVGFYWFSLGTQVLLGNPVSLLLYVGLLARFFRGRVRDEEAALEERFGDAYRRFRATRHLLIPGA